MEQYTSRDDTPLYFHSFFRFVGLPVNALVLITVMVTRLFGVPYFAVYLPLACSFTAVCIVLNITIFIGFYKWRPFAWYFVMGRIAVGIAGSLIVIILCSSYRNTESLSIIAERACMIFVFCYIAYYYLKRKPLFFKKAEKPETSSPDEN